MTCPCGSGQPEPSCCGRFLAGADAPTPEALMRSRYTAFVRGDASYLVRTLHPLERARARIGDFRQAFAAGWHRLEIVEVAEGMVHFRAHHRTGVLEERSRFAQVGGVWTYRDGRG